MTFYEWVRGMKGMEYDHTEGEIIDAINDLPAMDTTFPTGDPQSFEDVKDALMLRGFSRDQIKSVRDLWALYVSLKRGF